MSNMQAATPSNKGKRPRARHSTVEGSSVDVQASEVPHYSMPTPLQYFVQPSPTNVVVDAEGLCLVFMYVFCCLCVP